MTMIKPASSLATLGLARADSFEVILAMRALSGMGSLAGVVSLQRMTVRLFEGRPLGLPMGISGDPVVRVEMHV